jgi:hypothetical protein
VTKTKVGTERQKQLEAMKNENKRKERTDAAIAEARRLLASPRFFNEFLSAVEKEGLVGEQNNALALLIVAVSRLLSRPLNALVKGASASGKNWLVKRVLRLLPKDCAPEISNASDKAWNYSGDDFRHRVIYLQERNQAAGAIHPIRLFISEGKLIRRVTRWVGGELVTKTYVARGPVASISTTTRRELEIDDETRHLTLLIDQSEEQTQRIVRAYTKRQGLSAAELRAWHKVQRILEDRVDFEIVFPEWFDQVAEGVFVKGIGARRYYPAFVEACRTVCLIRSFQANRKVSEDSTLLLEFADFAIAALIFDGIFVESLNRHEGSALEVRESVRAIADRRGGEPVQARDLARELGISLDRAYARLREAEEAGTIRRVNAPEKDNRKFYLPAPKPRFIPDPEKLFRQLEDIGDDVRFVHPLTGKLVNYTLPRRKKAS